MPRRDDQDRARINMGEPSEVEYWARTLGVSEERLAEIVKKVGESVGAVRADIRNTRSVT